MGLNDSAEMLEACKADVVRLETALDAAEKRAEDYRAQIEADSDYEYSLRSERDAAEKRAEALEAAIAEIKDTMPAHHYSVLRNSRYRGILGGWNQECTCGAKWVEETSSEPFKCPREAILSSVSVSGWEQTIREAREAWEYGLLNPYTPAGAYGRNNRAHLVSRDREHVERQWRRGHPVIQFVRRRPAGPWEEVKSDGE